MGVRNYSITDLQSIIHGTLIAPPSLSLLYRQKERQIAEERDRDRECLEGGETLSEHGKRVGELESDSLARERKLGRKRQRNRYRDRETDI